jgi:hypothetical protein
MEMRGHMRTVKWLVLMLIVMIVSPNVAQTTLEVSIQPIRDLQWSPNGAYLAVAQETGGLSIYDDTLTLLANSYPQDTVSSVSWSPDSTQLAIEHLGQLEILSWDSDQSTLTSIRVMSSENPISSVAWNSMGDVVATAEIIEMDTITDDLTLRKRGWATYYVATWNIQSGEMIMRTSQSFTTQVEPFGLTEFNDIFYFKPIVWKPDGNKFLLARIENMRTHIQGQVITLDYQIGTVEDVIALPFSPITMALKPNSTILAVTFDTGTVEIDVNDYRGFKSLHANGFQAVMSWSPDGRFLLIDRNLIDAVNQDNIEVGETVIARFSSFPFSNAWHPYRPIIAIGSLTGRLTIEDATRFEGFTASPIANAGDDLTIYGELTATLIIDGYASMDYDGTITGYEWRLGDTVLSTDATATLDLPLGSHEIQLTVTDDDDLTDSDTVQITVTTGE